MQMLAHSITYAMSSTRLFVCLLVFRWNSYGNTEIVTSNVKDKRKWALHKTAENCQNSKTRNCKSAPFPRQCTTTKIFICMVLLPTFLECQTTSSWHKRSAGRQVQRTTIPLPLEAQTPAMSLNFCVTSRCEIATLWLVASVG